MVPGDLIAERFVIEHLAGSGGMGAVYRGLDRRTGQAVAIKVLHRPDVTAGSRFEREAEVLAELEHPGIVRYVAHGRTPQGEAYLVIEWLQGIDLAERLRGPRLTLSECVTLVQRAADALSAAHARGILHRDIKPSNLYLVGGDLDQVKLLDFGIARLEGGTAATRTGVALGTPGYMAPEQARGDRDLDARADVFALGCVLFECLAGRPVFQGEHVMAILAKVLLEEAPRVSELRPDVPPELDRLVARMLSKNPAGRPADCPTLVREIDALGAAEAMSIRAPRVTGFGLTAGEKRLICVVVSGGGADTVAAAAEKSAQARNDDALAKTMETASVPVLAALAAQDQVQRELGRFGARIERLLDGSMVATLTSAGTATDQAARAARFALAVRTLLPSIPVALATGRGWAVTDRFPMGEVIDRAAGLLRLGEERAPMTSEIDLGTKPSARPLRLAANAPSFAPKFSLGGGMSISAAAKSKPIRVDEVTAGLLDARFEVGGDAHGLVLHAEREQAEASRTLLGQETPCVGRERELSILHGIWDECLSEPVARAVLITAGAGVGKSRLRHEFLRKVQERSASVEIWTARGDPMSAGAPFGMIAPALRRTAGIYDGEPLGVRRQKLRARVGRHIRGPEQARVAEFLGELLGAPFPAEESVELAAARKDSVLMGDQMRRAFEEFLAAECAAQPLILVLEDLHWGDLPSVQFLDGALPGLDGRPFLVLALARPEVRDLFPRLWEERAVYELRLGDLTRKASEKLARAVLGEGAAAATIERVVAQAAGNAFYLEELLRAVVEGKGVELPETVLAMIEARLERVDSDGRRALRAGSVFGQAFWRDGVVALLGGPGAAGDLDATLARLVEQEMIQRRASGRFPGQTEYVFRMGLVREAAYAMLPEADRILGHRLAAEWLEHAGETEARVLAEHYERGQDPDHAAGWYQRAAAQALEGNDFSAAIARAERGIASGAAGELLGRIWLVEAEAHRWQAESGAAARAARAALDYLPRATGPWWSAVGELAAALGKQGEIDTLVTLIEGVLGEPRRADERPADLATLYRAVVQLVYAGRYPLAGRLLERIGGGADLDPSSLAQLCQARAAWATCRGDVAESRREIEQSIRSAEAAGDRRMACAQRAHLAEVYLQLGGWAEAERASREALEVAGKMGLYSVTVVSKLNLGSALTNQGRLAEASAVVIETLSEQVESDHRRAYLAAEVLLAEIYARAGDLPEAERWAAAAAAGAVSIRPLQAHAAATLSRVLLMTGRVNEALAAARSAMSALEALGKIDSGEALVRLAWAEALWSAGKVEGAREAIAAAREALLERAEPITEPAWRESFLRAVPENAMTLARAQQWVGDEVG